MAAKITISCIASLCIVLSKREKQELFLRAILQARPFSALLLGLCLSLSLLGSALPWTPASEPAVTGDSRGSSQCPLVTNCSVSVWWPSWSCVHSNEPSHWAFCAAEGSPVRGLITSGWGGSKGNLCPFCQHESVGHHRGLGKEGQKPDFCIQKKKKCFHSWQLYANSNNISQWTF